MAPNRENTPPASESVRRTYRLAGQDILAPAVPAGLYLVATPIGNLRDITLRALETLAGVDLIACEDTRVTRKLLDHYGIDAPTTPYHDHNAEQARPKILGRLGNGGAVALVSDAGTPLISDPGYKLVRAVCEASHPVVAIPGASSVLAALGVAGLPTDRFFFEGFVPPKSAARQKRAAELSRIAATLVLFESGPRIGASLADLASQLGGRQAAVCRELTKLHEEIARGDLHALARKFSSSDAETRGEFVLVIAPPSDEENKTDDVDELLRNALTRVSVKDAVGEIVAATGLPRREIYQRALTLTRDDDAG